MKCCGDLPNSFCLKKTCYIEHKGANGVPKQTLGEVYMTSALMSKILYQRVMTVFKYFRSKYLNRREDHSSFLLDRRA